MIKETGKWRRIVMLLIGVMVAVVCVSLSSCELPVSFPNYPVVAAKEVLTLQARR